MVKYYFAENSNVHEVLSPSEGCWINLLEPTEEELIKVAEITNLDFDTLNAAMDEEETARIETEDEYTMIIVDIPTSIEKHNKQAYITIPLSIIFTKDYIITVCDDDNPLFSPFESGRIKGFFTRMRTRFILQILYRNASMYLQYLRSINKKSEIVERRLHHSTQNKELIQLLELEKSLVYFTTSLKSNDVILEKLMKNDKIKFYSDDEELLEDTIIENKQAIEMANIYSGILSGTMDAFASIISNNLNIVMKVLATLTIVLSIPTMVFSAYGMNVSNIPFSDNPWSFLIIISAAIGLSVILLFIFLKLKMFK